jgi:AmmeMemoRadiSam system protein B
MRAMRVLCVSIFLISFVSAAQSPRLALPIVAGVWYPAEKDELIKKLDECMSGDEAPPPPGRIKALIVPHAPYQTFGDVAGAAFKLLQGQHYSRVIVLAPAHYSSFRGCSIPSVQGYLTPLGDIPLDGASIRALDMSTLIEVRTVKYGASQNKEHVLLHEKEYTIEVVLPFLQRQLGTFQLIPILVGDFLDYKKDIDTDALKAVAQSISRCMDDDTLLVVSSDFTHFGNNFSYRPFRNHIIEGIESLDNTAFELILKKDFPTYIEYLRETQNKICGKNAIAILLDMLPRRCQGRLLRYEVSARHTNDTKSSISYASLVFTDPEQPAATKTNISEKSLMRPSNPETGGKQK